MPASCLTLTPPVCSLLAGSLPSGSHHLLVCVTHPQDVRSLQEGAPLHVGILLRWGPVHPASHPFNIFPRFQLSDPCLQDRNWLWSENRLSGADRGWCWGLFHPAEARTNTKAVEIKSGTRQRWRWPINKTPLKWKWYDAQSAQLPVNLHLCQRGLWYDLCIYVNITWLSCVAVRCSSSISVRYTVWAPHSIYCPPTVTYRWTVEQWKAENDPSMCPQS